MCFFWGKERDIKKRIKVKEQLLKENDQLKTKIAEFEKSELKSSIWLDNGLRF